MHRRIVDFMFSYATDAVLPAPACNLANPERCIPLKDNLPDTCILLDVAIQELKK